MEYSQENCKEITRCLCCNSDNLRSILDLGKQSPVNNYNIKEKYPLRLNVCLDCSHAQLSHCVNPNIMFKDYPYMSGVSKTMLTYYKDFAKQVVEKYSPSTIFEIGCNDGFQLDEFKKLGVVTSGIDPAENLVPETIKKGHDIICGYFPKDLKIKNKSFDVIVAQNVFAHNSYPYEFLEGCKKLMSKDSVLILQNSQSNMIDNHQFDTIYHEHISFFNKRSIAKLLNRCNLELIDYQYNKDIHGGSDLFFIKILPEISILDYSDFSNRSYKFATQFKKLVDNLKQEDNIICYGAAAKMINLLRFSNIFPTYILDDTPTKIGKFIGDIEIKSGIELDNISGGYIIPVWNFYNEIVENIEKKYPSKFKFIKYIPEIQVK